MSKRPYIEEFDKHKLASGGSSGPPGSGSGGSGVEESFLAQLDELEEDASRRNRPYIVQSKTNVLLLPERPSAKS